MNINKYIPIPLTNRGLWLIAILFFVIGDLVTTFIGFQISGIIEGNPLFVRNDILSLIGIKFMVVYLFWRGYKITPSLFRHGIPIGLAAIGLIATMWNSLLIIWVSI